MSEHIFGIMKSVGIDSFSFLLPLLINTQVKAEKHQVRKVVQDLGKLTPAHNTFTCTTYQIDYTRDCHYSPIRRTGRFYTITKGQLDIL